MESFAHNSTTQLPVADISTASSSTTVKQQEPSTTNQKSVVKNSPVRVCNHYKMGTCRHGANGRKLINNAECKFVHPPKCKNYCKFGRDGCDGSCGLLHPILCSNSLRFRECLDEKCTFAHLVGTKRRVQSFNYSSKSYPNYNNQLSELSNRPMNSNRKFLHQTDIYPPTTRHQRSRKDEFVFHQNEFPPLYNKEKIDELTAIQQMQGCLNVLMHQNNKFKHQGQSWENNQFYPSTQPYGFQQNQFTNSRQIIHNDESKNYPFQNQALFQ